MNEMKDNKSLILDDGSRIEWFNKSYKNFLNKTTLLYGRTRSGKSTIILEIINLLKNHVPIPFIISKSNGEDFIGKVPKFCIKSNLTKEWLEDFLIKQKGRAKIYRQANDMRTLKDLFDRIKTPQEEIKEKMILQTADKYIQIIEYNDKLDYSMKRTRSDEIKNIQIDKLKNLYKSNIRQNKPFLESMFDKLNKNEICCVRYVDFLPNALLIFDDCASIFKKWVKESTVIKEIFYAGRWSYITFIITAQDDKEIDSELRKNAINSYFTTAQAAMANFTRASNSYTRAEKQKAELCIRKIFHANSGGKNHKKLVYVQDREEPFLYTIAELMDDFKIGCPSLWELDRKMEEKGKPENEEVKGFFDKYCMAK